MRGEIFCVISKTVIYCGLGSGVICVLDENVRVDFINEESANQFKTIFGVLHKMVLRMLVVGLVMRVIASDDVKGASKKIRLKNDAFINYIVGYRICKSAKISRNY